MAACPFVFPRDWLQVESDIAPYKGLLMGLFFMTGTGAGAGRVCVCVGRPEEDSVALASGCCPHPTPRGTGRWRLPFSHLAAPLPLPSAVGMEISVPLFFGKLKVILGAMALLIAGKVAVMTAVGQAFGLTLVQSMRRYVRCTPPHPLTTRSGLVLSPGGEFAFVLFGEAVSRGIMGAALAKELYLVVALSMALTPFLAQFGGKLGAMLEKSDMKALQPKEGEMQGMSGHVIIAGFGRVGELIGEVRRRAGVQAAWPAWSVAAHSLTDATHAAAWHLEPGGLLRPTTTCRPLLSPLPPPAVCADAERAPHPLCGPGRQRQPGAGRKAPRPARLLWRRRLARGPACCRCR